MAQDVLSKDAQIGDLVIYSRYKRGGLKFGIVIKQTEKTITVCDRLYKDSTGNININYFSNRVNEGDFIIIPDIDSLSLPDSIKNKLKEAKDYITK